MTDWDEIRKNAFSDADPPSHWPKDVRPITVGGVGLFGLDPSLQLYFDGKKIEMPRPLDLRWWQSVLAVSVSIAVITVSATNVFEFFGVSGTEILAFFRH